MNMEQQIMQAAEQLFLQKGYDMTSTVEIARTVGCNQALVHYYFRTKENLFILVFMNKVSEMISAFTIVDNDETDFFEKVNKCIDIHFDTMMKTPNLPYLILFDLVFHPERRKLLQQRILNDPGYVSVFSSFDTELRKAVENGIVRPIATLDLILDVVSLNIFAFLTAPILKTVPGLLPDGEKAFLEHRKEETKRIIAERLRL